MTKPLVIYHGKCADGFTAAWVFYKKFGNSVDFHPGVFSEAPPDATDRIVYLVDFSYKRAVVEAMISIATKVVLIDHHKTALEDLAGLEDLEWFTDNNRSGAQLAWDYLYPLEDSPLLVKYVQDRDLWQFQLDHTREITSYVFAFDQTFENWDKLDQVISKDLNVAIQAGNAMALKQRKDLRDILDQVTRTMEIAGHLVPTANVPFTFSSDAGHILSEGHPFAACYTDTKDHRAFSLRSNDAGLDVAVIAAEFGGGGHRNAAGFKVPRNHPLAML
ncbi:DHHA1 domain-containing protein [Aquirhabdus parva]|uniref:Phosphohydrolase n=1 Tax=Aquirhabdus parva TaxID=2283318 RepID=A0A345P6A5_9GAMM|nr:DHHA1 domain-containing protein [Aquirhabdus parva]AXI02814.1 phosphohydrolase [Aquirhabdus parva]